MSVEVRSILVPATIRPHACGKCGSKVLRSDITLQSVIGLSHASVVRGPDHVGAGEQGDDGLSVMAHDVYGYQRELSMHLRRAPGTPLHSRREWSVSAYRHSGRLSECVVSGKVARAFIERFWQLTTGYPSLLFNASGQHRRTDALVRAIKSCEGREMEPQEAQRILTLTRDAIENVRPRHEGFVQLHERLLDGATPSVSLL